MGIFTCIRRKKIFHVVIHVLSSFLAATCRHGWEKSVEFGTQIWNFYMEILEKQSQPLPFSRPGRCVAPTRRKAATPFPVRRLRSLRENQEFGDEKSVDLLGKWPGRNPLPCVFFRVFADLNLFKPSTKPKKRYRNQKFPFLASLCLFFWWCFTDSTMVNITMIHHHLGNMLLEPFPTTEEANLRNRR